MIFAIATFLANKFGFDFNLAKRIAWIALAVIVFLILLAVVFAFRGCGKREVKIDESQIQKINSENEAVRKKQLEEIIYENEQIIKTVDERSNVAEINRIEKEREIQEKIEAVDKRIEAAKAQGRDVSQSELVCLLQPTECK